MLSVTEGGEYVYVCLRAYHPNISGRSLNGHVTARWGWVVPCLLTARSPVRVLRDVDDYGTVPLFYCVELRTGMGWGSCHPCATHEIQALITPCSPKWTHEIQALITPLVHQMDTHLQALIPPLCTKWTPAASIDTPLVHQMDTHLQALIPPLCTKWTPICK